MHRAILVGLSLLVASTLEAQTPARATRADGSVVLLFADGTWKPDSARTTTRESNASYQKPTAATASLDILKGATLAYNPAKWTLIPSDQVGRRQLIHSEGDGYALIIAERLQMPIATLKNIVLQNARKAAPDARIVSEEQRRVNGLNVTCLEITGTAQGIPFRYFGYYYAGKVGTIQVITYTGESLYPEYRSDFEELLNGFMVTAP